MVKKKWLIGLDVFGRSNFFSLNSGQNGVSNSMPKGQIKVLEVSKLSKMWVVEFWERKRKLMGAVAPGLRAAGSKNSSFSYLISYLFNINGLDFFHQKFYLSDGPSLILF